MRAGNTFTKRLECITHGAPGNSFQKSTYRLNKTTATTSIYHIHINFPPCLLNKHCNFPINYTKSRAKNHKAELKFCKEMWVTDVLDLVSTVTYLSSADLTEVCLSPVVYPEHTWLKCYLSLNIIMSSRAMAMKSHLKDDYFSVAKLF